MDVKIQLILEMYKIIEIKSLIFQLIQLELKFYFQLYTSDAEKKISYQNNVFSLIRELKCREGVRSHVEVMFLALACTSSSNVIGDRFFIWEAKKVLKDSTRAVLVWRLSNLFWLSVSECS